MGAASPEVNWQRGWDKQRRNVWKAETKTGADPKAAVGKRHRRGKLDTDGRKNEERLRCVGLCESRKFSGRGYELQKRFTDHFYLMEFE